VVAFGITLGVLLLLLLGLCWRLASRNIAPLEEPVVAEALPAKPKRTIEADREQEKRPAQDEEPGGKEEAEEMVPERPSVPRATPRLGPPLMAVPRFATFMGTRAWGRRFCIIADCSGSMGRHNRMGRLKNELKKTLADLEDDQEVHVIFFHTVAEPMPVKGWLRGGKDVERILPWINKQRPRGGTEPMPAFTLAFALEPRADAIFFMTDGLIPNNVPEEVGKLNSKAKVPISTILFGGEEVEEIPGKKTDAKRLEKMRLLREKMRKQAEGLLQQISRDSGGSHRFVPDEKP
jgi:hypothetical protein